LLHFLQASHELLLLASGQAVPDASASAVQELTNNRPDATLYLAGEDLISQLLKVFLESG